MTIPALSLPRTEKVLRGSWYGSARPWLDLPKMVELYMGGPPAGRPAGQPHLPARRDQRGLRGPRSRRRRTQRAADGLSRTHSRFVHATEVAHVDGADDQRSHPQLRARTHPLSHEHLTNGTSGMERVPGLLDRGGDDRPLPRGAGSGPRRRDRLAHRPDALRPRPPGLAVRGRRGAIAASTSCAHRRLPLGARDLQRLGRGRDRSAFRARDRLEGSRAPGSAPARSSSPGTSSTGSRSRQDGTRRVTCWSGRLARRRAPRRATGVPISCHTRAVDEPRHAAARPLRGRGPRPARRDHRPLQRTRRTSTTCAASRPAGATVGLDRFFSTEDDYVAERSAIALALAQAGYAEQVCPRPRRLTGGRLGRLARGAPQRLLDSRAPARGAVAARQRRDRGRCGRDAPALNRRDLRGCRGAVAGATPRGLRGRDAARGSGAGACYS